jgi:anti-sigma regulatory factor (Ser/Thr protein kinase)
MTVRRALRIDSDPASFPSVIGLVDDLADAVAADPALRHAMHLVVEELCVNVMRHGYGGRRDGWIAVTVAATVGMAHISIEDAAPRFDPFSSDHAPDPTAPLHERVVGGLGLRLVRHVALSCKHEWLEADPQSDHVGRNRVTVVVGDG